MGWRKPREQLELIPDPLGNHRENCASGSGISQRAAAARTQTVWRWLVKRQASSLTAGPGYDRMNLERINYENKKVLR